MRALAVTLTLTLLAGCTSLLGIGEPGAAGTDAGGDDDAPAIDASPAVDAPPGIDAASNASPFEPRVFIPTGVNTRDVAIADLDGNGQLDIVAANQGSGDVSVLLALGGGSFADKVDYSMASSVECVVAVDLDMDSFPDLVTGDGGGQGLTIRRNDPAQPGTFLAASSLGVGVESFELVAANLMGGDEPELLVTGGNRTRVVLNNGGVLSGGATFTTTTGINNGAGSVSLDGDGLPDLAVMHTPHLLLIRQDPANPGTFLPETHVFVPSGTGTTMIAADVNADGFVDLVFDGALLLQDATTPGQFLAPMNLPNSGGQRFDVVVAPVGGGPLPDLLYVDHDQNVVDLFVDVSTSPLLYLQLESSATGARPRALAAGDLNQDGEIDVVTADDVAGGVSLLFHR